MSSGRKLTHKNLMADNEKVKQLATLRGTSESEAVRVAIEFVLAAEEMAAAIRGLHELGGIDDVFRKMPEDRDDSAETAATRHD
jgi:hypothetical protein